MAAGGRQEGAAGAMGDGSNESGTGSGFRDVNKVVFTHAALKGERIEVLQGKNIDRKTGKLVMTSIGTVMKGEGGREPHGSIDDDDDMIEPRDKDATAIFVWPAASPLCQLICERSGHATGRSENNNDSNDRKTENEDSVRPTLIVNCDVRGKSVIELGCGPGLPGIVAAKMGAERVVLCDKPSELELPRENAERNGVADIVTSLPCYWGDDSAIERLGEFDIVLISDCLYGHDEEMSVSLFKTMKCLCKKKEGKIIMSYQFRENVIGDMPFFDLVKDSFDHSKCIEVDNDVWIFEWS